tara:strand:- start:13 stop:438 length:426 start_codon:yes stop_codon:yes gene_type:complete
MTTKTCAELLDALVGTINAIDVSSDSAGPDDKFAAVIGQPDRFLGDRMVVMLPSGSRRSERVLDRKVHEMDLDLVTLYRLTPGAWSRAADDAGRIAEAMHEIVSTVDSVQNVQVDMGLIDTTGDGYLSCSRSVSIEWNRTA